jgi:protein pelota
MKIVSKDLKKGTVKLTVENLDDLWYLSHIIDPDDLVKAKTERKIKIGDGSTDRNVKVVRKTVFLELKVEKTELSESLRILGTITQGPDDISFGSHHSFDIGENDTLEIKKEKWLKFQLEKLDEAVKDKGSKVLIIVFDREEAYFGMIRKDGFKFLTHIKGNVQKKDNNDENISNFYTYILKTTDEYDKIYGFNKIIASSPAFWKDELVKNLNEGNIKQKMVMMQ